MGGRSRGGNERTIGDVAREEKSDIGGAVGGEGVVTHAGLSRGGERVTRWATTRGKEPERMMRPIERCEQ